MKNKGNRVVITGTVYNLLFNLLLIPEEDIKRVLFFTCDSIPKAVRQNLKKQIFIPDMHHIGRFRQFGYIIKYRLLSFLFCPGLNSYSIFAQDHLPYMPIIVGRRKYNLVEDGPGQFKINEGLRYVNAAWLSREKLLKNATWFYRLLNPLLCGIFGRNEYCEEICISKETAKYIPNYLKGKKKSVLDMHDAWKKSSEEKKNYILHIFNIYDEDILMLKSRHVIVFTQPFYDDGDLSTLEEHIEVYRKVMADYDLNNVVIKTHPRERTDYQKYFPEARVFNKPVPFQLLDLLGLKFTEAATVCSSAALSIPYPIKVKWVGAKVHPNLLKEYGDFIPEELKN